MASLLRSRIVFNQSKVKQKIIAVSGLLEHCTIFHFPSVLHPSVRSSQA